MWSGTWRKAYGALNDSTKAGLTNLTASTRNFGSLQDLDIAIVKATNHVESPPKERHFRMEATTLRLDQPAVLDGRQKHGYFEVVVLVVELDSKQITSVAELQINNFYIIDLATLTGACVVALGPSIAGIFTPSDELAQEVTAASELSGEKFWRLPMEESYSERMKSGVVDMRRRFVRHRWGAPPAVSGLGINRRQNFAGRRHHVAAAGRRRHATSVNRRLATPVDNNQGLDPGLVAGSSAPPPLNSDVGAPEPGLAARSPPRWCRVHGYGPCPTCSIGTRLPSPTPAEEEEREIVAHIPARGYSPAPTRVAGDGGDDLIFVPTPGREMATVGTNSAPWAFGRSPALPGEQPVFLFGTGGTRHATDVAGTSSNAGPPVTSASRRLLFGRSVAAVDRRPGRRRGTWNPASLGLTSGLPNGGGIPDYTPSSDEEEGPIPSVPASRR
ncbi:putative leucine aminopeptidase [Hordeum vulgare]|nr:putative leucine aminopeptidase [Hordeum vulgare]